MWFCRTILGLVRLAAPTAATAPAVPWSSSPFTRDDQSSDIFSITDMIYYATRTGFLISNFLTRLSELTEDILIMIIPFLEFPGAGFLLVLLCSRLTVTVVNMMICRTMLRLDISED